MNSANSEHQTPHVSSAVGTNWILAVRSSFFAVLLTVAFSAAAQAEVEVHWICDAVKVSVTVMSQASGISRDQGTSVASSGLFPSRLDKPTCSMLAEI